MEERPTRERMLLEEIEDLKGRVEEVGASDRALFEGRTVPREGRILSECGSGSARFEVRWKGRKIAAENKAAI